MKSLLRFFAAAGLLWLSAVLPLQAGETHTVTLAFELDGLDLDTGTLVPALEPASDPVGSDIRIGYNADRPVAAVVLSSGLEGVELAFLADTGMHEVSLDTVAGLAFSPEGDDQPFTAFDTVVVKTDAGAYYTLGNVTETAGAVSFDYRRID